jgi:excisionase family DNA binding protein
MNETDLLTTIDVARELGITRTRVHALIVGGRLPARKLGRDWTIRRADLVYVAERRPGKSPRLLPPPYLPDPHHG